MIRILLIIIMAILPLGNAYSKGMPNQQIMKTALDSLVKRTNEDSFVIFYDKKTRKFVQFAGQILYGPYRGNKLLLNLPTQMLSVQEMEKSRKLFKEYGVTLESSKVSDSEGDTPTETELQFFMPLKRDTEKAAMIATRIFKEVYGLPDNFELEMEEN